MRHAPHAALLLAASLLACDPATADPPKVSSFFPAGGRVGESVRVEAKGTFEPWPVRAHVDRPGVRFEAEETVGVFTVTIADDAAPGLSWVRLYNDEGAATLRPFVVGTLPEVMEAEPNDADDRAQPVDPSGVVVNGRLEKPGDVDAFAVPLESGQTLVAALEANDRIGAPMDGKLQVVSPEGFVVDHADDSPLLDPALAFTAPTSGTYLVRVFAFPAEPDSSIRFAGGDEYIYRLTLTTGGVIDLAHPSAVGPEGTPEVAAVGWNLPGRPLPLTVVHGPDGEAVGWHPELAGTAELAAVEIPVILASDTRSEPATIPALICGQLGPDGADDRIRLRAEPGASVRLRVEGRSLRSPIDAVIRVEDSSGAQLAEMDDLRRSLDPELTVKAPDDGLLEIRLRDLHRRGGSRFLYRLEAREPSPDFTLTVASDHFELETDAPLAIEVAVNRDGGYEGAITVEAEGLPDGVAVEPAVSEPEGDSSKKVTLRMNAEGAEGWSGPIRLIGVAAEGGTLRTATAERVGGTRTASLWLTVKAPAAE